MTAVKSVRRCREGWTPEDSQRELEKWVQSASVSPIVYEAQDILSENMWFFLDNIAARCERYRSASKNVVAQNPNNTMTTEQLETSLAIPDEDKFLSVGLRRFVVVEDEEVEASTPAEKKDVNGVAEEGAVSEAVKPSDAEAEDVEGGDDEDDDDDDDEDKYDAVEEMEVKFPSNALLVDQMKLLKQAGTELATVFDGIVDWIALGIPDIRVDDNDSVDVMTSIMEATSAHSDAVSSTVTFHREYLDERADAEIEVLTFPHSPSLRRQLIINDLEAWSEVERGWQTLLRCSLIVHTLISKNMRKLLNPRNSSRSAGIYQ